MPEPEHIEVAVLTFHVETDFAVDVKKLVLLKPVRIKEDISEGDFVRLTSEGSLRVVATSLAAELSGVMADIMGPGFKVSGVRFRTTGSFEILVAVVAAYQALKTAVEVVETLQKATAIGRRLVRTALASWGLPFGDVDATVRLTQPVLPQTRQTPVWQRATLELRLLIALVALNLSVVAVVLVILLRR
ncbi:hypothetical protein [Amycolatopsis sp. cg9]|uniref:hypothetical protein n=1 Tax=Amycolatopsis sp. cg9 TaxID=3238801 RepID=UPI00352512F6